MKFYHAEYKMQKNKGAEVWVDIRFLTTNRIIVLADDYSEAFRQVEDCLRKKESNEYRAVLVSDIEECVGIDIEHGFDDTWITPLIKE